MSETIVCILSTKVLLRGRLHVYIQRLVEEGFLVQDKKQLFLTEQDASRLHIEASQCSDYISGPVIALLLRHLSPLEAYSRVRGELEDVYSSHDAYCALSDRLWLFPSSGEALQRAVLVAGPEDGLLGAAQEAVKEAGFALVHVEKATLSQEQAKQFVSSASTIASLSAREVHLIVVERSGAVDQLKLIVGPEDPECARLHAPSSLRARFGATAVLCSGSAPDAERQIGLVSSLIPGGIPLQRTLVLLLPALVSAAHFSEPLDLVARAAERAGLSLVAQSSFALSGLQAQQFADTDAACPTASLGSGPIAALVLAKSGAAELWRSVQEGAADGPVPLHRQLSAWLAASGSGSWPLIYSSPSAAVAEKQISFLFPHLSAASLDSALVKDTLFAKPYVGACAHAPPSKALSDVLTEALTALCKQHPKPQGLEAVSWLSRWLLSHSAEHVPTVLAPAGSCTVTLPSDSQDDSAPVEVVVSLSHPASSQSPEAARCRDGLLELIETSGQYERLSLSALLARAAKGRGEHAAAVNQSLASGKPVLPAVAAALVVEEVKARGASRVLLCDAEPSLSLELAMALERALAPPKLVLNIDSDAREEAAAASAVHYDKAVPVLSHYKQLDKVATVLCSGSAEPQLLFDQIKSRV